ncbi:hypothetical protein [Priestia megaterium]|uniref:hypothetical protein n=1 Tax=Priestia megaterium TaxID=1404 RepID=UPI0021D687FF|nr:hypothetical protein [Priestia megaterium]MCU7766494.1 hypothetical protein [Priestia megaterium]
MSVKSDLLEQDIADVAARYSNLPSHLPQWLIDIGVKPNAPIISATRVGAADKNNKTDVLISLENSSPIKISAKLSNADYFGNWYGHVRFLSEFGEETFNRLTEDVTRWANWWVHQTNAPFVGVSICFGKRTGNTAKRFLDIFSVEDIYSIVRGFSTNNYTDNMANCLYINSNAPQSLEELLDNLEPITEEAIKKATGEFMIAYRPINPLKEGTNRGKNVYTQFVPNRRLEEPTVVTSPSELAELGEFKEVTPNRLNHNHVLNTLEKEYNIIIPRKQ